MLHGKRHSFRSGGLRFILHLSREALGNRNQVFAICRLAVAPNFAAQRKLVGLKLFVTRFLVRSDCYTLSFIGQIRTQFKTSQILLQISNVCAGKVWTQQKCLSTPYVCTTNTHLLEIKQLDCLLNGMNCGNLFWFWFCRKLFTALYFLVFVLDCGTRGY